MKFKLFILALALVLATLAAPAQTAQVIELAPDDALQAQRLYNQKADIEKQIADLQKRIHERYVMQKDYQTKAGWEAGFEFSTDFLFIVPKSFFALRPQPIYPFETDTNLVDPILRDHPEVYSHHSELLK